MDKELSQKIEFLMQARKDNPVVDYVFRRWEAERAEGKYASKEEAFAQLFVELAVQLTKSTDNLVKWCTKLQAVRPYQIADPIGPYVTVWENPNR